jgi:hypothetical protein
MPSPTNSPQLHTMASPKKQNRFALLVGVDLYLDDGSRKLPDGGPVSLSHLQGAINDVNSIEAILRDRFQFNDFTILTSSSSTGSSVPSEPEDKRPTHANIKKAFDEIYKKANPGDVFVFYFAGHGALLDATPNSPNYGREKDRCLMTSDYCLRNPAIRGWELNEWLYQFNDKNVRVVVLLDSCYSGGSWRNDVRFRSPENWTPPPNLPADEASVQGIQRKPGHRDGDLGVCWDINPKDFTLVAACESTEKAAEKNEDNSVHGAFTLALKKYFQSSSNASNSTYRVVRDGAADQLASWDLSQKPQVFGQDRLAFLEDYEPFLATPIIATVKNGIFSLPVGQVHGINPGAEFVTTSTRPKVVVSIKEVDDHSSTADVQIGTVQDLSNPIELIPSRWSSRETFEVVMDPGLEDKFRETLPNELRMRIAGNIRFSEDFTPVKNRDPKAICFWLRTNKAGGIDILGPEQLVGAQGPVRGWKSEGKTEKERAIDSARAIAHLFRFGQILHLRSQSQDTAPFRVSFESDSSNNRKIRYVFENDENEDLYFAVLILSPGFHVKQLFPVNDALQLAPARNRRSFLFSLAVPDKLRPSEVQGQHYAYRDIIRTVVTKGGSSSLKSMELPDIWSTDRWDEKRLEALDRGERLLEDFSWWIQDDEKFTV